MAAPIGNSRSLEAHNDRIDQRREEIENEDIAEQAALSYVQHNTFERIQADIEGEVDGFTIGKPSLPPPPVSAAGISQHHLAHQRASSEGQAVAMQLYLAGAETNVAVNKQRLDAVAARVETLGNLPPHVRDDILASTGDLAAKVRSGELSQGAFEALLSELETQLSESGQKYAEGTIRGQQVDAEKAHKKRMNQAEKAANLSPAEKFFGAIAFIFAAPILSIIESGAKLEALAKGSKPTITPLTDFAEKLGLVKKSGPDEASRPEGPELAANGLSHLDMLKLLLAENPETAERKKELQEAILALQSGNPIPAEAFLGLKPEDGIEGAGAAGVIDPQMQKFQMDMLDVTREVEAGQIDAARTENEIQRQNPV